MRIGAMVGFTLLVWTGSSASQELTWKPAAATSPRVTLGRPEPLRPVSEVQGRPSLGYPASIGQQPVVRAQAPEPPPPPPPPPPNFGTPVGPAPAAVPVEEPYGGVANGKTGGGWWSRMCDWAEDCWKDCVGGLGCTLQGRSLFQSDHCFDYMVSPVTNPFYFEDPRSLTQVRPIFMWQRTPDGTPLFAGGDNFFAGLTASLALTDRISITVNKLGWVWTEFQQPAGEFNNHSGFSELHLGPKLTIIRNENSRTLAAVGLVFELPIGGGDVFQDTGDWTLRPYFSFGQNFCRSDWGSFNFLATAGYAFAVDSDRSDNLFAGFHLDYNVGNLNKIYPLIEVNWAHYTANGNVRDLNFEGRDMFNFGSRDVNGNDELTVALGARYAFSPNCQMGIAAEFGVLNRDRNLDDFRLTLDLIFRY